MLVVLDTNVLVSALRSRRGTSFALLSLVGSGKFEIALSVPLVLEYEDACARARSGVPRTVLDPVLDYLCSVALHQPIFFLWRPFLPDPKDDMVAEVAFAASARFVVTHNVRDFRPLAQLGVQPISPASFLRRIRHP